ncbi:MAG: lytic murein transglycosylase [Desulforhopalus sp.]|jgi:membrane-bound lytic murein transglycosylase B|nr:lytic murein transglycosylase [Desulforhopalus sp.]
MTGRHTRPVRPSAPPPHRHSWAQFVQIILLLLLGCGWGQAMAAAPPRGDELIDLTSEHYRELFAELATAHNFRDEELSRLFTGLRVNPRVLRLIDLPGEAKPYYAYRRLFINAKSIAAGRNSLSVRRGLFDRIEAHFGVNREVIVAIWAIESRFGTNTGGFALFQSLNTLFDRYPRRAEFFRSELVEFLLLCRANGLDPLKVKGSYAGAFGQAQFMPSSFNRHAVDFDGDGTIDLFGSLPDIFASIANYLAHFGWTLDSPLYAELGDQLHSAKLEEALRQGRSGLVEWQVVARTQNRPLVVPPLGKPLTIVALEQSPRRGGGLRHVAGYPNFQTITAYNHSNKYAMAVSELSEALTER